MTYRVERTDLVVKTGIGIIVGIISLMNGWFGAMVTVLIITMGFDFITGVLSALAMKKMSSKIGTKGLIKKVYTILLLGAILMIETYILKSNGVITDGIAGAFAIIELASIVENGVKMGIKIPDKLNNLMATLKADKKIGSRTNEGEGIAAILLDNKANEEQREEDNNSSSKSPE